MVILIGAESCTGKTLMAQKLLEQYKIPYLSTDLIKMGLYRANANCDFSPDDSNEVIEECLWPILKAIIEVTIENGQNIIIEGCYIFPKRLREFREEYKKHIIPVFFGFSSKYIEKNYSSGIINYNSVIERRDEEDRPQNWFIQANSTWKQMCADNFLKYFEIDGDYLTEIAKIHNWIDGEIYRCKITH